MLARFTDEELDRAVALGFCTHTQAEMLRETRDHRAEKIAIDPKAQRAIEVYRRGPHREQLHSSHRRAQGRVLNAADPAARPVALCETERTLARAMGLSEDRVLADKRTRIAAGERIADPPPPPTAEARARATIAAGLDVTPEARARHEARLTDEAAEARAREQLTPAELAIVRNFGRSAREMIARRA